MPEDQSTGDPDRIVRFTRLEKIACEAGRITMGVGTLPMRPTSRPRYLPCRGGKTEREEDALSDNLVVTFVRPR